MCSGGEAQVFTFSGNVFSFWGDVFSLAAHVFSFQGHVFSEEVESTCVGCCRVSTGDAGMTGMCPLCQANVSSFLPDVSGSWPDVSTFRPNVSTLAGEVSVEEGERAWGRSEGREVSSERGRGGRAEWGAGR